jgi:hypothetical protein
VAHLVKRVGPSRHWLRRTSEATEDEDPNLATEKFHTSWVWDLPHFPIVSYAAASD